MPDIFQGMHDLRFFLGSACASYGMFYLVPYLVHPSLGHPWSNIFQGRSGLVWARSITLAAGLVYFSLFRPEARSIPRRFQSIFIVLTEIRMCNLGSALRLTKSRLLFDRAPGSPIYIRAGHIYVITGSAGVIWVHFTLR